MAEFVREEAHRLRRQFEMMPRKSQPNVLETASFSSSDHPFQFWGAYQRSHWMQTCLLSFSAVGERGNSGQKLPKISVPELSMRCLTYSISESFDGAGNVTPAPMRQSLDE
jgi:hypothetical protein